MVRTLLKFVFQKCNKHGVFSSSPLRGTRMSCLQRLGGGDADGVPDGGFLILRFLNYETVRTIDDYDERFAEKPDATLGAGGQTK